MLYFDMERLGIQPCDGGYFDQPWTMMQDLKMVSRAIQHKRNALALTAEHRSEFDELGAQARSMAGI